MGDRSSHGLLWATLRVRIPVHQWRGGKQAGLGRDPEVAERPLRCFRSSDRPSHVLAHRLQVTSSLDHRASMMGGNDFEQQYFHMEDDGANESMNLADVLAQHGAENGNAIEEDQVDHDVPPESNQHHQHQHEHEHEHEQSQQHGNEQPQVHHQEHNPSADVGQSASDTAAAAMAQYHTMTIPQTTEQSFLQQTQQQAQQQQNESGDGPESFTDFDVNNPLKEGQAGRHN